jgi:hypothetical protein
MSCKYSADGSFSCSTEFLNGDNSINSEIIESFSATYCTPGSQNLPLPYMGKNNCKAACIQFSSINNCPYKMTDNPNIKKGICECPLAK